MASKKRLSGKCIVEVLFNEDSEEDLIPEFNSSQAVKDLNSQNCHDLYVTFQRKPHPTHHQVTVCLPFPPFTVNACLNTDIQNTVDVICEIICYRRFS
jgi:hypothetical protein